jgi:hypothetical protein
MPQTTCAGMSSPIGGPQETPLAIGREDPATDAQAFDATRVLPEVGAKRVPPTPSIVGASWPMTHGPSGLVPPAGTCPPSRCNRLGVTHNDKDPISYTHMGNEADQVWKHIQRTA